MFCDIAQLNTTAPGVVECFSAMDDSTALRGPAFQCPLVTHSLQLASQCNQAFTAIIQILDGLTDRLQLFDVFRRSLEFDRETLQELFDILVELIINIVSAIRYFRRNPIGAAIVSAKWTSLDTKFFTDLRRLRSRLDQLHKLADAKTSVRWTRSHDELVRRSEQLSMNQAPVSPSMKCNTIPYPQNSGFFGRDAILNDIAKAFEDQSSRVAAVALWGTGGIGKTKIALEFAHRAWQSGTRVVLWIGSETPAEVANSFNDASRALGLDSEVAPNTLDSNRHLVLRWIQQTGRVPAPKNGVLCIEATSQ